VHYVSSGTSFIFYFFSFILISLLLIHLILQIYQLIAVSVSTLIIYILDSGPKCQQDRPWHFTKTPDTFSDLGYANDVALLSDKMSVDKL